MMQLIWHGPFAGQSGYEVITREILVELDKMGVQVALDESPSWNRERLNLEPDVIRRFERMLGTRVATGTPAIMHQRKQPHLMARLEPACKTYVYTLFETDRLPVPWESELKEMDGVFTFSNFNKDAWVKTSGLSEDKVHVLPWGTSKEFNTNGPRANILNKKGFTFMTNGDFTERKNFEVLVEAYTKEFKPNEDVCLLFKTHFGGFTANDRKMLLNRLKTLSTAWVENPPKIVFYGDKIPTVDMANLYRACDCFVLPSRGEGLGLPIIEAMACGLPIIATNWSALPELGFKGHLISHTLEQIDSISYIKKCPDALNHNWASASVDDLRTAMRDMFEHRDGAKAMGIANSKIAEKRTWHDAAVKIVKVILGGENNA